VSIETHLKERSLLTVDKLFEIQAALTPDSIAVTCRDESLTYNELNTKADKLAHYLQETGVSHEDPVGIYLERSVNLIVSILAVLKVGGAYVPIDGDNPEDHISFIIEDTQLSTILSQESIRHKLPPIVAKIISLDNKNDNVDSYDKPNNEIERSPSDLAYILFTSGTTGKANGVNVQHSALVNAFLGWEEVYNLRGDKLNHLQMARCAFDVFSGDMLRALCSGGRLVLCPKPYLLQPKKLYDLMCKEEIDFAEFVPAVLRKLITYLDNNDLNFNFMKILICASDNWSIGEYRRFREFCAPNTRIINSYGVTEATIDSTYYECTEDATKDFTPEQTVPIGKPFANTEMFILDRNFKAVKDGSEGEIYIGGVGVARGYHQRPAMTQERFLNLSLDNPFGPRLFKTGDVGRRMSTGDIELLGRVDNQVKIRGIRVELTGIENTLNIHPDVNESIIKIFEDEFGHKRLVVYVVRKQGHTLGIMNLRKFLQDRLPSYMIPSTIMEIDSLPVTDNGKLNRYAELPLPINALESTPDSVPPSSETEIKVAAVWREVLLKDFVGIFDTFFELGGDSILLPQLSTRLQETFEEELSIIEILASPTIYQLSQLLDKRISASKRNALRSKALQVDGEPAY